MSSEGIIWATKKGRGNGEFWRGRGDGRRNGEREDEHPRPRGFLLRGGRCGFGGLVGRKGRPSIAGKGSVRGKKQQRERRNKESSSPPSLLLRFLKDRTKDPSLRGRFQRLTTTGTRSRTNEPTTTTKKTRSELAPSFSPLINQPPSCSKLMQ